MKRFIIFIYLTLLVCATALQAQVNFTVKPPSRVYEGQRFPVTFRLTNADGSDLKVSQINGCSLLYGPSVSQSQSYQVVNGKASSTSATEYTYYYKADKAGTFTIPAASIIADGKHLSTKAVTFTVHSIQDANTPASQRPVDFDDVDTQAAGGVSTVMMCLSESYCQNHRLMNRKPSAAQSNSIPNTAYHHSFLLANRHLTDSLFRKLMSSLHSIKWKHTTVRTT